MKLLIDLDALKAWYFENVALKGSSNPEVDELDFEELMQNVCGNDEAEKRRILILALEEYAESVIRGRILAQRDWPDERLRKMVRELGG